MKKLNSGFIMSIVSSILLLLEVIGVKVNVPYVNEVTMAVLGVLVALGVIQGARSMPKKDSGIDKVKDSISDGVENIKDNIVDMIDDVKDAMTIDNLDDNIKMDVVDDMSINNDILSDDKEDAGKDDKID